MRRQKCAVAKPKATVSGDIFGYEYPNLITYAQLALSWANKVHAEQYFVSGLAVRCQSPQRFFLKYARILVYARKIASYTRSRAGEGEPSNGNLFPVVFFVRSASCEHEVRPEAIHRDGRI